MSRLRSKASHLGDQRPRRDQQGSPGLQAVQDQVDGVLHLRAEMAQEHALAQAQGDRRSRPQLVGVEVVLGVARAQGVAQAGEGPRTPRDPSQDPRSRGQPEDGWLRTSRAPSASTRCGRGRSDSRIVVIDSDQGESGASATWREGLPTSGHGRGHGPCWHRHGTRGVPPGAEQRPTGIACWRSAVSLRQDCVTAGAVNSYAERGGVDALSNDGIFRDGFEPVN